MRAWVYRKNGPVSQVLKLENDYPTPSIATSSSSAASGSKQKKSTAAAESAGTKILVRVKAVGLNAIAYKAIAELPFFATKKPAVPEVEFSGIVEEISSDLSSSSSSSLKVGDEVFGMIPVDWQLGKGVGALAEFTVSDGKLLVSFAALLLLH